MLAPTEAQAEVVACHPKQEVVAVGYADGLVLLVRIDDGAEVLAHKPGGAPVTALAWSATGDTARLRHRGRRGRRDRSSLICEAAGIDVSGYCFFCAPPFGAARAAAGGASALSGSRFQTWLRPNSEMPR